jgi:hypothetical protein
MTNCFAVFTQQFGSCLPVLIERYREREQQIPSFLLAVRDKAE